MSSSVTLTNAVTSGDERAVSALLANGVDVNESTSGGQTALILAVIFGHTKLVQLLVAAGADPQLRDNLGLNAIEWAKRRGSREALEVLTNPPQSNAARRKIVVEIQQPEKPVAEAPAPPPQAAETKDIVTDDEKSRRWLAGLKQRLDEQELQRPKQNEPAEPPPTEPIKPPEPAKPVTTVRPAVGRIFEPPPEVPASTGKRKRCPKCNAIYNGDLISYCAHHIVPLVDADEQIITDTPQRSTVPMFWILVLVTLGASIVMATIASTYIYRANQPAPTTAPQPTIQKGFPELGRNLVGKAVALPEAECPLSGSEPLSGSVAVDVKVDRTGQVHWARASGGDWLMRGAATEAAMKSTFAPDKLRGREIEGTITYTFKPQ